MAFSIQRKRDDAVHRILVRVGGRVARDRTKRGDAVAVAAVAITLYIWWAFRNVPNAWRYGISAVVALLHDVLLVVGVFSILGKLFDTEVDTFFITGLLTVVGFSVHDSIVVFDRIRENVARGAIPNFPDTVNHSLLQTMGRSFNTSLTLIFSTSHCCCWAARASATSCSCCSSA